MAQGNKKVLILKLRVTIIIIVIIILKIPKPKRLFRNDCSAQFKTIPLILVHWTRQVNKRAVEFQVIKSSNL